MNKIVEGVARGVTVQMDPESELSVVRKWVNAFWKLGIPYPFCAVGELYKCPFRMSALMKSDTDGLVIWLLYFCSKQAVMPHKMGDAYEVPFPVEMVPLVLTNEDDVPIAHSVGFTRLSEAGP